jgi:tRNA pseudouridine38-40 synthase
VRTLTLLLAYDGTDFVGWQRQASGVSIQGLLEDALARLEGASVTVSAAGRTDAGVHATGQVASVQVASSRDTVILRAALNATLPRSLRVLRVDEAPDGFHARFSARGKVYHYRLLHGPVASPFSHRYAWHVPSALDHRAMQAAAQALVGTHDFAAFQSTGSDVQTSVRTITISRLDASAAGSEGGAPALAPAAALPGATLLTYVVAGSGFLRHMVRAIVGTLVDVGAGRRNPGDVGHLLAAGRRDLAGPTAPALGLCLAGVVYDEDASGVATQR